MDVGGVWIFLKLVKTLQRGIRGKTRAPAKPKKMTSTFNNGRLWDGGYGTATMGRRRWDGGSVTAAVGRRAVGSGESINYLFIVNYSSRIVIFAIGPLVAFPSASLGVSNYASVKARLHPKFAGRKWVTRIV
jgi:hypothetical protein